MNGLGVPRALTVLLAAAGAVVTLAGIQAVNSILGPAMLALVLVIAVSPLRSWLTRRKAPVWLTIAAPLAVVLLVLLGMMAILSLAAAQLALLAPNYSGEFQRLLVEVEQWLASLGVTGAQINKSIQSFDPTQFIGVAQGLLAGVLGALSSLFLIVVLVLAMSLDAPVYAKIIDAARTRRPAMYKALTTFTARTRRYLIVSTVFGLICSVLDVIALYMLDVPLPVLWGILALITNYIPNVGFVLGLIPPALLGLLSGGFRTMLLVILAYIVINVVIQSFIQPKFLGDAVGLSTTVTFLSLIIWAFVLGPLGALLAIPLSLLTRALLIDSDPNASMAAALISGEPPAAEPSET